MKKIKIEITKPTEEKLTLDIWEDSSIDEFADNFKTILKWLTFHENIINTVFKNED